nr:DM13 domain-containing protein [Synechococcus sp. PCC 7336]
MDENFRTDRGPDLFVLLHARDIPRSYNASDYVVNLGRLERVSGTQRYRVPEDVDIEAFESAVIWCRRFNVTFGYATFGS